MAELKKIRRYYTPGYFTPRLFASGGQAGGYGYYYGNNAGIGNTGSNVSGGASGGGSFMSNFGSNFGSIGSAAMGTIGQWTDAADINAEQQIGTQSLEDIRNAKSKDQLYGNSIDASTIHFKRPGLGASLMEGTMYGVQGGTAISPGWGCVCAGTIVYTKDGQCKKIEDLCKEDGILGFSDGEIIPQNIIQMQKPGYKECVKIEAESGLILECSADHPIMCSNSDNNKWYWKEAKDILPNEKIAHLDMSFVFGEKDINWRIVESVTPIGVKQIYNLEASDSHTYIANNIVTHNTLIGGAAGFLSGLFSNQYANRRIDGYERQLKRNIGEMTNNQNLYLTNKDMGHSLSNQIALGGWLNNGYNQSKEANKTEYAMGGLMKGYGMNPPAWYPNTFGAGGTHEEMSEKWGVEGILQGYDANGAPNLVEENEVKWNDYIFSNRLVIPKGVKDAALPTNIQDKTFAEAAQVLSADTEERPFDPVAKRGLEVMLGRLAQLQEVVRMEQAEMEAKAEAEAEDEEMMEAARYFAFGGDIRDSDEYKLRIQSLLDRNKREWQRYKKQYPDSDDEEVARYLYRRDNRWNPLNTEFVSGDKRLQQFVNEEAARNGVPASVLYNQISNSGMIDRHVAAVKDGWPLVDEKTSLIDYKPGDYNDFRSEISNIAQGIAVQKNELQQLGLKGTAKELNAAYNLGVDHPDLLSGRIDGYEIGDKWDGFVFPVSNSKSGVQSSKFKIQGSMDNLYAKGGDIKINPKNKGLFTAAAKRAGMGVQEYARHILANKERYSPTMRKRANFARNFGGSHADGGSLIDNGQLTIDNESLGNIFAGGGYADYNDFMRYVQGRMKTGKMAEGIYPTLLPTYLKNKGYADYYVWKALENTDTNPFKNRDGIMQALAQIGSVDPQTTWPNYRKKVVPDVVRAGNINPVMQEQVLKSYPNDRAYIPPSINVPVEKYNYDPDMIFLEETDTGERIVGKLDDNGNIVYNDGHTYPGRNLFDGGGELEGFKKYLKKGQPQSNWEYIDKIDDIENLKNSYPNSYKNWIKEVTMARENLAAAAQRVDEVTKNLIQRSQEIQAKEKNKNDKDIINLDNGMFELPGRKIKNGANFQNSERGLVEWVRDYLPEDIIITAGGDRENEHASGRRNIDLRSRDNKFWAWAKTEDGKKAREKLRTLGYDWYFEQGKKGKNSGDHITINSIDMPKNVFEADYFYAITEEGKKGEKLKGANPKVTSLTRGAVPNTTESESNITLSTMGIDPKTGTIGVQGLGIGNVDNEKLDEKKPAFARYINRVKANDLDYGDNVYSLRVDGDPGKFELEKNGLGWTVLPDGTTGWILTDPNGNKVFRKYDTENPENNFVTMDTEYYREKEAETENQAKVEAKAQVEAKMPWERYAPVFTNLALMAKTMASKPDTMRLPRISAPHVNDYMSYTPIDSDYIANQQRQMAAATNNALIDQSGGNPAIARSMLLSANRNNQTAIADSLFKASEYNRGLKERAIQFNANINAYNAGLDWDAIQRNAQMKAAEVQYETQANALRQQAINDYLAGIGTQLGQIGMEKFEAKRINQVGYDIYGNPINRT